MNLLQLARSARAVTHAETHERDEITTVPDEPAAGRLLRFDPARRRRTEQRLAAQPCRDCLTVAWYVNARGDATCQTCARRRAATTPTRTDDVRGAAS